MPDRRRGVPVLAAVASMAALVASCSAGDDAVPIDDTVVVSSVGSPTTVPADDGVPTPTTVPAPIPVPTVPDPAVSATAAGATKEVRTRSEVAVGDGVRPEGFTTVGATITSATGEECTVCLWLAATEAQRAQGLMGVTDLGDAVGMAFTWDAPTTGRFFMFQTPAPLSIAFFDVEGRYVSEADMEPCLDTESGRCARYSAAGAYQVAVEMLQGELDAIGIGPGSTIELLSGSESIECP